MKLFDTHTHINDERFDADRDEVIARMREAGVDLAIVIGCAADPIDSFELADAHDFLYASAGVHPHEASEWSVERAALIRKYMGYKKAVAVGEIGLDYHYDLSPRDMQRRAFIEQLDIACDTGKPVILHVRDAHGEATDILTERYKRGALPPGVMHCYTGSWESAKQYMKMGLYISLAGAVTFKNAPKVWEVARNMPIDRLLIETDCPYLAPTPMRGKRNEPAFVKITAEKIAELRGERSEDVALATYENGRRLFGI